MKKTFKILIFILISILTIGCNRESEQGVTEETTKTSETVPVTEETDDELVTKEANDETEEYEEETKDENGSDDGQVYGRASEYILFAKNTRFHFQGDGMEYSTFDVHVDFVTSDKIQIRTNNSGTEMVEVYQRNPDNITRTYFEGETYYRENLIKKEDSDKDIILKDPIKVGNSWSLSDGRKRTITDVSVPISTKAGNYTTIEVTTKSDEEHGELKEYFAKDLGLVKREFNQDDLKVTSTLSVIEKDVPFVQTVRFFYPDDQLLNIIYDDKEVSFRTNDIPRMILEKAYKNISKPKASKVLPENAKINSLYLNNDEAVYIDFSKELITEMNAGAGYEGLILQSVVNTFGNYYGVEEVYLTVDNQPYESGHILFRKGEKVKVNMDDVID